MQLVSTVLTVHECYYFYLKDVWSCHHNAELYFCTAVSKFANCKLETSQQTPISIDIDLHVSSIHQALHSCTRYYY